MAASMDSTCETKTLLSDQFETNFCENIEWQAAGGMGNHLMYQWQAKNFNLDILSYILDMLDVHSSHSFSSSNLRYFKSEVNLSKSKLI